VALSNQTAHMDKQNCS